MKTVRSEGAAFRSICGSVANMAAVRFIANKYHAWRGAHLFLWVALASVHYSYFVTGQTFDFFQENSSKLVSGVVFNSMLAHLLQGDFAVDPDAIRLEAFDIDGKTYAYFGIAPALLRLPLLLFEDFTTIDITRLSIVMATCVSAYFKCASLTLIKRLGDDNAMRSALYGLLVLSVLFGGAQIQFLKPSIYQEAICWAMALCSAFIYGAMRGLFLPSRFSTRLLVTLACLAGLALLTRVTAGIGLYAALCVLLVSLGTRACFPGSSSVGPAGGDYAEKHPSVLQWLTSLQVVLPLLVLFGFAVLCGIVNYGRWGNPFVFADLHLARLMVESRIAVVDQYGEFNIYRLPYAVMYYFLPITYLHGPDGAFLFDDFRQRYYDGVEPPPSSFLVSDPATLLLAVMFLRLLIQKSVPVELDRRHVIALLAGFTVPVILILTYYFLAFRFRGEFYPLLEFAAMLGFYAVSRSPAAFSADEKARFVKKVGYCVFIGMFASHFLLMSYRATAFV